MIKNNIKIIIIGAVVIVFLALFRCTAYHSRENKKMIVNEVKTSTSISITTRTVPAQTITFTTSKKKDSSNTISTRVDKTTCFTTSSKKTNTELSKTEQPKESATKKIETSSESKVYVVYKPSTHYIHKSTCHWAKIGKVERIENTDRIKVRKCSECNPDMEIIIEYIEPEFVLETTMNNSINSNDRELLAQIVWHEAGSDWISIYDKAMIVAGVMNRVNDDRFPSTVYGVLTQPGQFTGFYPWTCTPTQSCYDAVDYYFNNRSSFGNYNSWWGDNFTNHFYYQ